MSFIERENNYVALWDVSKIYYYPYHPKMIQERMLTNASPSVAVERNHARAHQQQELVH